jgi:23S rRNA (uridine2552-2'-O)-methyltransferase
LSGTRLRVSAALVYRRKDAFYTRAKAVGYRSRAAFKLLQLAHRHRLFRPGDHVIDLGAWPGGWLQVAAEQVGPTGRVVGVDQQPIAPLPQAWVSTVAGDVSDPATQQAVIAASGASVDVLLSDLAPKLSGVRARDQAQAQQLAECVVQFAQRTLKPGGTLVVKLFASEDLQHVATALRALFREVRLTRPEATRKGSPEIYAIATGFRAKPPAQSG